MDNFINIEQSPNNATWVIRSGILESINKALPHMKGKFLDVGCGKKPYYKHINENSSVTEYVGLDIENSREYDKNIEPEFRWDGYQMPFDDNSFDSAMATEVLEHCPSPQATIQEIHRVLKKDGTFFFTTPFIWPLHEVPYDFNRLTPFALNRMFEEAGFKILKLDAMGGWHTALAQFLGAWINRSPISKRNRKFLKPIIFRIQKYLVKRDVITEFNQGAMISGTMGIVIKK